MVEDPRGGPHKELMFHRLARYYDLLASGKDYRAEAARLGAVARRFGRTRGRAWLDVACGTGRHLEYLERSHEVVGLDLSREMLAIARARLPGVPLYRGDMRSFDLGRRFDVVTCLYSAVGHLASERELLSAYANFARHLRPGGVAIVEPWFAPEMFHDGSVHATSKETPELAIARVALSRRAGRVSRVRYRYVVARAGRRIEEFDETSVGLLVPTRRHLALLESAGLRARFLKTGLSPGRGLLVGVLEDQSPARTRAPGIPGCGDTSAERAARPPTSRTRGAA